VMASVHGVGLYLLLFFFFFQAEDGIRDRNVTGVQTCALPISGRPARRCWATSTTRPRNTSASRRPARPGVSATSATASDWRQIEIGRASCRERVEISVGGGAVKKKR